MKTLTIKVPTGSDVANAVTTAPTKFRAFRYNRKVAKVADLADEVNGKDVQALLTTRAQKAQAKADEKAAKAADKAAKAEAKANAATA